MPSITLSSARRAVSLLLCACIPLGAAILVALALWNVEARWALATLAEGAESLAPRSLRKLWQLPVIHGVAFGLWWGLIAWFRRRRTGQDWSSALQATAAFFWAPWVAGLYVLFAMGVSDGDHVLVAGRLVWILALSALVALTAPELPLAPGLARRLQQTGRMLPVALLALTLAYLACFTALSFLRHVHFHSNLHDLGLYDQMMWNSLRGDWFRCTLWQIEGQYDLKRFGYHFMAEHFMVILIPLLPLYALWQDPRMLLLIQTVALAGAGPVLWLMMRRAVNPRRRPEDGVAAEWLGFALAVSFLLHPLTQLTNVKEFHADALEPVAIFWMGWAFFARRPWHYALAMVMALSCKEDVSVSMAAFGVYVLLFTGRRQWGAWTIVAGLAWYGIVIHGIMPYGFRDGEPIRHLYRYHGLVPADTEPSMGGVIQTLLFNPVYVAMYAGDFARLASLLLLFVPVAFLPFWFPPALLICAPSVAANLLVNWPIQYTLDLHYGIGILPWVYLASAMVFYRRSALLPAEGAEAVPANVTPVRLARLTVFILLASVLLTVHLGRSPVGGGHSARRYARRDSHGQALEALAMIPAEAAVSAHSQLGAHLTGRRDIFQFPTLENAEVILLDIAPDAVTFPLSEDAYRQTIADIRASNRWQVLREWPDQYVLFRRVEQGAEQTDLDAR